MNLKERVKQRVSELSDAILDCEACGEEDSMQLRRSSLNQQFYADDVLLKCSSCYRTRTHGIAFEDPDRFKQEWDSRDGRVIDFARDSYDPSETLEALGYVGKSKTIGE